MSSTLVVPDSCKPPPLLWFWFLHVCCFHVDRVAVGNCWGDDGVAVQAPHKRIIPQLLFSYIIVVTIFIGSGGDPARSQLPSWSWIKDMLVLRVFGWDKGNFIFILRQNNFSLGLIKASRSSTVSPPMSLLSSPRRNSSNSNWNNADTSVLNMFACTFLFIPKFKILISIEQRLGRTPQLLTLLC